MKKVTKISSIALCTLFLFGCDQFGFNTKKSESTPHVQIQVDPKADFQKFTEFQQSQNAKVSALNEEITRAVQAGDLKALEPVLLKFSTQINEVAKELDALPIYSAEIIKLKEQAKNLLLKSSELMIDNVKLQQNPTPQGVQSLVTKKEILMKIADEFTKLNNELAAKYGEPAAQ
ncbi:hypothetical protein [Pasteurella sp. PK-2025]|uniref:hypothetical protein n=1 Tax=unclassified Pasteurella TaxID=2621516 RepID=UPI003C736F85